MFVGSDRGGDRAAVFYTLIKTAKLNGLDPEVYIAAIIIAWQAATPANFSTRYCHGTSKCQTDKPPCQNMATWLSADAYVYPLAWVALVLPK